MTSLDYFLFLTNPCEFVIPIYYFLLAGNIDLLKYILAKGVEVDPQSDVGTPLVWAAGHAQHDAVKVLLEHHANVRFHVIIIEYENTNSMD